MFSLSVFSVYFSPRLAGGVPPYAETYKTWLDCWQHLSREVSTQTDCVFSGTESASLPSQLLVIMKQLRLP